MQTEYPKTFDVLKTPDALDSLPTGHYWVQLEDRFTPRETTRLVKWQNPGPGLGTFWLIGSEINEYPNEFKRVTILSVVPEPPQRKQEI